jgi:Zn finger protein HypA/HybF involved in hydrogenase expression
MTNPIVINERQQAFNGKVYVRHRRGYYHHNITYLHRAVWEAAHGPLPKGRAFHVHHIDGDKGNNALENLQLLGASEHLRDHMTPERRAVAAANIEKARPGAAAWHGSVAGRAWHSRASKDAWANRESVAAICKRCGSDFLTVKAGVKYCSRACCAAATRDRREAGEAADPRRQTTLRAPPKEKKCAMCGAAFFTKSGRRQHCDTCTPEAKRLANKAAYAARAAGSR